MQQILQFQLDTPSLSPNDEHNQRLVRNVHPPTWQNPTPAKQYNLLVIGGGSAGLVAAAGAAGLGAKVALVERHLLGGDCLNVGCVPSKTVIRSAKVIGEIARADRLGVHLPERPAVDFAAIMARMRRVRADLSEHDSVRRFQELGIDVFLGEGSFRDGGGFAVDGRVLRFNKAVIATGSRPADLPIPGMAESGFLTNESIWSLTERPQRLAVIGAGPIGAELAQAFRRFGSEVIVFDILPRMLGREDEDAANLIHEIFEREGIRLALGAQIRNVERSDHGKQLTYMLDDETHTVQVDEILLAAGRTPNLETLNLDAAGVKYNKKGVEVDETLRSTNPKIYAAGDVAFKYQFTHTADATARLVLRNALFPGPKQKVTDLIVPWATYTDPEVAHVGMYDWEAEQAGIAVDTIVQSIGATDRGRADGESEGFVKVHIRRGSDRILGATIVASHAGEIISEITVAMSAEVGLKGLAQVIHPYPTQAEAIKKVADAYNRTRLTPAVKRLFAAWFSWVR